ncbi:hypothetical protein ACOSQ2_009068 [Xanthoceras sorbifolium]
MKRKVYYYYSNTNKVVHYALNCLAQAENFGKNEFDFDKSVRVRSAREKGHSDLDSKRPGQGFDDFDRNYNST